MQPSARGKPEEIFRQYGLMYWYLINKVQPKASQAALLELAANILHGSVMSLKEFFAGIGQLEGFDNFHKEAFAVDRPAEQTVPLGKVTRDLLEALSYAEMHSAGQAMPASPISVLKSLVVEVVSLVQLALTNADAQQQPDEKEPGNE